MCGGEGETTMVGGRERDVVLVVVQETIWPSWNVDVGWQKSAADDIIASLVVVVFFAWPSACFLDGVRADKHAPSQLPPNKGEWHHELFKGIKRDETVRGACLAFPIPGTVACAAITRVKPQFELFKRLLYLSGKDTCVCLGVGVLQ